MHNNKLFTTLPVTSHTDYIGYGSTFVAIKGMETDGHYFIQEALARGATTIVLQQDGPLSHQQVEEIKKNAHVKVVENCRKALAELSATAFEHAHRHLKIIAITGTKGKTSTAFLLHHFLKSAGYRTALLSTVYNCIDTELYTTNLTTQHPDYLHAFFKKCKDREIEFVVMEVAAQAYSLFRVHQLQFDGLIFTNFDQEHGEFYPTIYDYFFAKKALFGQLKENALVLINNDNQWCKDLRVLYPKSRTFGKFSADYNFNYQQYNSLKNCVDIKVNETNYHFETLLLGEFNAYNLTAAISMAMNIGIDQLNIQTALKSFAGVPGRFEQISLKNGALCIIDYAHNPSSYQSLLPILRSLTSDLIVVSGAGGDRDATKRPLMGKLVAQYANTVIFTSDNPRSEDPINIIDHLKQEIDSENQSKVITIIDRKEAIAYAYSISKPGSCIALLGKGPDHYQIIKGVKHYFNESQIIQELDVLYISG